MSLVVTRTASVCSPCRRCGVRDLDRMLTCNTCHGLWHARCATPSVRNDVVNGWYCNEHWNDAVAAGWRMQRYVRPPPGPGASAADKTLYNNFLTCKKLRAERVGVAFVAVVKPLFGELLRHAVRVWWIDECPLDYFHRDCHINVFSARRNEPMFFKLAVGVAHIRGAGHLQTVLLREMLRIARWRGGQEAMMEVVLEVTGVMEVEVVLPEKDDRGRRLVK